MKELLNRSWELRVWLYSIFHQTIMNLEWDNTAHPGQPQAGWVPWWPGLPAPGRGTGRWSRTPGDSHSGYVEIIRSSQTLPLVLTPLMRQTVTSTQAAARQATLWPRTEVTRLHRQSPGLWVLPSTFLNWVSVRFFMEKTCLLHLS